jgi:glycosyltransferase involved in cell wall biosynthesis
VKILLVNWQDRENPQAGGAEIHLHEIFGRLVARGHAVDLFCSGWRGCARHAVLDGMRVTRRGGRHSWALQGRSTVRHAAREDGYDVIVEDVNKIPLFTAGLTSLPSYVIVPHLFGTTAFGEASWPVATAVWLLERPLPRAYRRSAFHAISQATADDLIARGVAPDRIRVIYPGVDTVSYRPDPDARRTSHPSFLYVGRLKRYKGVDTAVRALAKVRAAVPQATLDIAGAGDDRARLEQLVERLGLAEVVRFHGFVDETAKRRLLHRTWANVFPSLKEGWGITNLEAAACGTPSLATDTSALRESVRDGETGFLVPYGDADALAVTMRQLATDLLLVERLGQTARQFAEGFSWARTAEQTEQHLVDTIEGVR